MFRLVRDGVPEWYAIEDRDSAIAKANVIFTICGECVLVVDMGTGEVVYERGA